jgi:hypothetical protein
MTAPSTALRQISSIGFSGSGFMVCYHLGVAQCLSKHGILSIPYSLAQDARSELIVMTGVSGGALTIAALAAGVAMDDAMQAVLNVNATCRNSAGPLDVLQPRFSLIDICEEQIRKLVMAATQRNSEETLRLINEKRSVRIGLTDRRRVAVLRRIIRNNNNNNKDKFKDSSDHQDDAYLYVDQYRNVEDLIAASIVSSYVPGITGPLRGRNDPNNSALARATLRLEEMMALGYVKQGVTGAPIFAPNIKDTIEEDNILRMKSRLFDREMFWDGGLVNLFPLIDRGTVIVSPLAADFKHNASITPAIEYSEKQLTAVPALKVNSNARIHVTVENTLTLRCMMFSSEDSVLEAKFLQGYENATEFLKKSGMGA